MSQPLRAAAASSIPLGLEFGIASCLALVLLIKKKPKGNFAISIAYSSVKLLAICSTLSANMNIYGISVVPFLVGLLINEVVLLILSIRLREIILLVPYSVLYRRRVRAIRFVSELSSVVIIVGAVAAQPFISCSCDVAQYELAGVIYEYCKKNDTEVIVGAVLTNQIKGLAFAISVTASIAAVSSMRFMASSIGKEISGSEDRDVIQWMMMDAGWKQAIRTVYGVLGIFVNGLFVFTFFYQGTNDCVKVSESSSRYGIGPVPASLLNAILAISQVFMADMLLRIAGEASNNGLDHQKLSFLNRDMSQNVELTGANPPTGAAITSCTSSAGKYV